MLGSVQGDRAKHSSMRGKSVQHQHRGKLEAHKGVSANGLLYCRSHKKHTSLTSITENARSSRR